MITVLEYPLDGARNMRARALKLPLTDRLDNPFEQKWILQGLHELGVHLTGYARSQSHLMGSTCGDPDAYFTALMRYDVGDYLALHYDAEVHPQFDLKKAVTAILYLSTDDCEGGALEFWRDDKLVCSVEPKCGTLVMFTNDWLHGNPQPVESGVRLALTCSYMSYGSLDPRGEKRHWLGRRKAYFVPTPGETWSDELVKLRDLRCDPERYAEAYKVGV